MSIVTRPDIPGVIYVLIDPRPDREGQIRYVGQSTNVKKRTRDYLSMLRLGQGHSPALRRWFAKLEKLGLSPIVRVVEECLFGLDAAEQRWIDTGRAKKWALLNCREGGTGGRLSDEAKRRISDITKSKWADPEYVAHWEAAMAKRWGFGSVDEWKAVKAKKEEQHAASAERRQRNMAIAAERRRQRIAVRVPLTCRGIAFVFLTAGKRAIVDTEDWARVCERNWYANRHHKQWRAVSKTVGRITLHQFVAGRIWVRAKSGDPLDCRKDNLEDAAQHA